MTRPLALALLASTALVPSAAFAQSSSDVLPTGGSVVAGSATIGGAQGGAMHIVQGSDRAIIDWTSFSVGQGNRVDITQPGTTSALLNRVTGTTTSEIAGAINANGRVFLVNPNGILITKTGTVNAAGFVASTLDIANKDFMAGSDELTVTAPMAAMRIGRATGGYAGLIDGRTPDAGLIHVGITSVGAGSDPKGPRAALDLTGDGFMQVALPNGGIEVAGTINAHEVVLRAGTAREAARGTVNLTGTIRATGVGTVGGVVTLTGDTVNLTGATIDASGSAGGGTITIGGGRQGSGALAHATTVAADAASTIRADATGAGAGGQITLWSDGATSFAGVISAKGAGGDGGDAEVSGHHLFYTGHADLTGARFGTLLLDPYNVTISTAADSNHDASFTATGNDSVVNNATLQNALATANVTVSTGTGGTQAGNITVAAPVTWSSGSLLTLSAANAIFVNAPISVTGGGKVALAFNAAVPLTSGLSFGPGGTVSFADGQTGQALSVNGNAYTLLYTMAQVDAIDTTGLAGRYALAHDLDAGGTTYATSVVAPGGTAFSGVFEGLNHAISNLTITNGGNGSTGLFGTSSGTLRDVGIVGGTVTGTNTDGGLTGTGALVGTNQGAIIQSYATTRVIGGGAGLDFIGGLAGFNGSSVDSSATIALSYATGTVSGGRDSGGLVGDNNGTITQSYATGAASSDQGQGVAGGLAGGNNGIIRQSYATGPASGGGFANGGLVGVNRYLIDQSYATGAVASGGGLSGYASGVGDHNNTITNSYWDTQTTGQATSAGGGTGLTTAQFQSGTLPAGFDAAVWATGPGLYPYLRSFFPNGAQAVSGIAYSDGGTTVLASNGSGAKYVFGNVGGAAASPVTTGANGYYYITLPNGTIAPSGTNVLTYTTVDNTQGGNPSGATLVTATGTTAGVNIYGGSFSYTTSATTYSAASTARANALTTLTPAQQTAFGALTPAYIGTNTAGFTIDTVINASSGLGVRTTAGPLTVAAAITLPGTGALSLGSFSTLLINAPISVTGGGKVALAFNAAVPLTGGLSFGPGGTVSFADGQTGQALSVNGNAYTLLYTMAQVDAIDTTGLAGRYALAHDLDAGGTTYATSVVAPGGTAFSGVFEGLNHAISNLTITNGGNGSTGLFGTSSGTLRDVGIVGGTVTGTNTDGGLTGTGALVGTNQGAIIQSYATTRVIGGGAGLDFIGGLAGFNGSSVDSSATIALSYATGTVSGGRDSGGLVGDNNGTITQSYATGAASSDQGQGVAGGLAGGNNGIIRQSYATGPASGGGFANGGLVGVNRYLIDQSYATGAVASGGGLSGYASGVGDHNNTITNSYWDTQTTGQATSAGGGTGLTTAQFQSGTLPAGFDAAVWATGPGLYPYLRSFFPNGAQAVSGTAFTGTGATAAAGTVGVYVGGALVGNGPTSTGANGYYYAPVAAGTLTTATPGVGAALTLAGATTPTGLTLRDPVTLDGNGNVSGLNVRSGLVRYDTGRTSSSVLNSDVTATFGSAATGLFATLGSTPLQIFATGDFALDSAISRPGAVTIEANRLTIVDGGSVTSQATGGAIVLAARTGFTDAASGTPLSAPNGRWLVYTPTVASLTRGALGGLYYFGDTYTFGGGGFATAPNAGNRIVVGERPTLTVAAQNAATTYSGQRYVDGYTVTGLAPGDTQAAAVQGTATGLTTPSANVGSYSLTPAGLTSDENYALAYQSGTVTISPATLTYLADQASRPYGAANPAFTGTVTGFVNGETQQSATTGTLTFSSPANSNSDVGRYPINGSGLAANNGNYVFVQAASNATALTITGRTVTVTADPQSRYYGNANPALTYTTTNLPSGATLNGSLTTNATTTSGVGSYGIFQGSVTEANNPNYSITYVGNTLVVTPRPIMVTADAQSRIYGNANPALTYSVGGQGLVNGDMLSGMLATVANQQSGVGQYAITQGNLSAGGNYAITYNGANLTVTPRALVVTPDAVSRAYGDANPARGTATADNLVNGDTVASVALSSPATVQSGIGVYSLSASNALGTGLGNYSITYAMRANGLTVVPRAITVTADAKNRAYGDANPALTYTVGGGGLVNGDALSGMLATAATQRSNVGQYAITQGTLAPSSNYALTYVGAVLAVTPRALVVTPDAISRVYGNSTPTRGTATAGNLVNGDTVTSVALSTPATVASGVGGYALSASDAQGSGLANYAISYATRATGLTITPRAITVAADSQTRVYGDANPTLTYRIGGLGLVNGDALSGALSTPATMTSSVGSYGVALGTLAAGSNYTLTYAGSTLTVTPRPITITADTLTRYAGQANGPLTYTVGGRGLVNGDMLTGAQTTDAVQSSMPGSYAITRGTLAASANYAVIYVGGALTIGRPPAPGAGLTAGTQQRDAFATDTLPDASSSSTATDANLDAASAGVEETPSAGALAHCPRHQPCRVAGDAEKGVSN